MQLPNFLQQHPYDEIRLAGHRIGLEHVIGRYRDGYSPEQLHEHYPTLPLELIHQVIAFYRENRAEVDAYVDDCQQAVERLRQEARHGPGLEELQRRLRARQNGESA